MVKIIKCLESSTPVKITSAKGVYVYGDENRKWLDFSASTNNLVLGHNPNKIVSTITNYLHEKKPIHTSSRYSTSTLTDYLMALDLFLPRELSVVNYKLTDGSDAVKDAIKAAVTYFHLQIESEEVMKIVVFKSPHHGETIATIAASPKHNNQAEWNAPLEKTYLSVDNFLAIPKLEKILQRQEVGAIMIEPIMVNAGIILPPENYLKELRRICDKNNVTLIFDEVQTGAGWLGKYTASHYFDVVPDIASFAKGLGNGIPIALVALKPEYDVLTYNQTAFTGGGTPLAMAIATTVINSLPEYMDQVSDKSLKFLKALKTSVKDKKDINEVRGIALMAGVEFTSAKIALNIYNKCVDEGLILRISELGNTLIWKPPIIATMDELYEGVNIFSKILNQYIK